MSGPARRRVVILGAAGRDFHNFNLLYRHDPGVEVVAFTATQIPHIDRRRYPAELAGELYPEGIPIVPERELPELVREQRVDCCLFSYSDISHETLMHKASEVLALGADFVLPSPRHTMIAARRPVVGICAVRTGCGKSQVARWLAGLLGERGMQAAAIRHPMPYGNPQRQAVQRFRSLEDLADADCTIEEREEYEPHIEAGSIVYAGIDYERIVRLAEDDADLLIWDGGNNDLSFLETDLLIVLLDPLRAGDETRYHPGETALRMADVAVIAKSDSATPEQLNALRATVAAVNPGARVVLGRSPIHCDSERELSRKRVLVVEDGPTLTHGGMRFGAGTLLARRAGAEIVDPRPFLAPELLRVFEQYPHLERVVPAMGYFPEQLDALAATIAAADVDAVVSGSPFDLARLIAVDKPVYRARYEYEDAEQPGLRGVIEAFLEQHG
jgi:predicted GTPase